MKHLKEVGLTYFQHLKLAFLNSLILSIASIALMIHAFLPFLFTKTASKLIAGVKNSFPKDIPK